MKTACRNKTLRQYSPLFRNFLVDQGCLPHTHMALVDLRDFVDDGDGDHHLNCAYFSLTHSHLNFRWPYARCRSVVGIMLQVDHSWLWCRKIMWGATGSSCVINGWVGVVRTYVALAATMFGWVICQHFYSAELRLCLTHCLSMSFTS